MAHGRQEGRFRLAGGLRVTQSTGQLPLGRLQFCDIDSLPDRFTGALFRQVPVQQRAVLLLRFFSHLGFAEIARMMLTHHVHRVLVGKDRMLEGVITSFDLLRVIAGESRATRAAS